MPLNEDVEASSKRLFRKLYVANLDDPEGNGYSLDTASEYILYTFLPFRRSRGCFTHWADRAHWCSTYFMSFMDVRSLWIVSLNCIGQVEQDVIIANGILHKQYFFP